MIDKSSIKRSLNKRYVDNQVGVYRALAPGARWCPLQQDVVYGSREEAARDLRPPDQRTMETIRDAANTVSNHITMTCDYPTANHNQMMPVLDIQCWVEGGEVKYIHFRKSMCSDKTILSVSALPARTKRNTHCQEVVRILRNRPCQSGMGEKS